MYNDILGSSSFRDDNLFGSDNTFDSFFNSGNSFDSFGNMFGSGNRRSRNNRTSDIFHNYFNDSNPFSFDNPSTFRRNARTNTSQRNNEAVRQDTNSNGILFSDQLYNNDQFIILSFTISEWFGEQGNPEEVVIYVTPFEEGQKTHGFLPDEAKGLYRHSTHPVNPYIVNLCQQAKKIQ